MMIRKEYLYNRFIALLIVLLVFFITDDSFAKRTRGGRVKSYSSKPYSPKTFKIKSYAPKSYSKKAPRLQSYKSSKSFKPYKSSLSTGTKSGYKRSRVVRSNFHRSNPCPSTGRNRGSCPGYEVDHIVPLACGGSDSVGNMQWLTKSANRRKGAMGCRRR